MSGEFNEIERREPTDEVGKALTDCSYVGSVSGRVRQSGLFASTSESLRYLRKISADFGNVPLTVGLLAKLDGNFSSLPDIDHLTIAIDQHTETEDRIADDLKEWLDRTDRRSALILVPVELLDLVWSCFPDHNVEILVDPRTSEIVASLMRFSRRASNAQLVDDRTEERSSLEAVCRRLEDLTRKIEQIEPVVAERPGFLFAKDAEQSAKAEPDESHLFKSSLPPLPTAEVVRRVIYLRQIRNKYFDPELFSDPAWDMLLDLAASHAENKQVTVSSLCIASGVPATTALRWINRLTTLGWLDRVEDEIDRRRAFVRMTDLAKKAMARYFANIA